MWRSGDYWNVLQPNLSSYQFVDGLESQSAAVSDSRSPGDPNTWPWFTLVDLGQKSLCTDTTRVGPVVQ